MTWVTRASEKKKIEALSNQEVSKSDQEKIATAEKALELVNKLTDTMHRKFEANDKELEMVRNKLNEYVSQCSLCPNNKITKTKKNT